MGQFLWIEDLAGLQISDGIAKWLCRLPRFSSQLKIQFSSFSKVQHSKGALYPSD